LIVNTIVSILNNFTPSISFLEYSVADLFGRSLKLIWIYDKKETMEKLVRFKLKKCPKEHLIRKVLSECFMIVLTCFGNNLITLSFFIKNHLNKDTISLE